MNNNGDSKLSAVMFKKLPKKGFEEVPNTGNNFCDRSGEARAAMIVLQHYWWCAETHIDQPFSEDLWWHEKTSEVESALQSRGLCFADAIELRTTLQVDKHRDRPWALLYDYFRGRAKSYLIKRGMAGSNRLDEHMHDLAVGIIAFYARKPEKRLDAVAYFEWRFGELWRQRRKKDSGDGRELPAQFAEAKSTDESENSPRAQVAVDRNVNVEDSVVSSLAMDQNHAAWKPLVDAALKGCSHANRKHLEEYGLFAGLDSRPAVNDAQRQQRSVARRSFYAKLAEVCGHPDARRLACWVATDPDHGAIIAWTRRAFSGEGRHWREILELLRADQLSMEQTRCIKAIVPQLIQAATYLIPPPDGLPAISVTRGPQGRINKTNQ